MKAEREMKPMAELGGAFVAGVLATVPMTIALFAIRRSYFFESRKVSPPKKIARRLMDRVLGTHPKSERNLNVVSTAMHFGYGGASALPYPYVRRKLLSGVEHSIAGPVYGIGIWSLSYMGWLPYFGIISHAKKANIGRNVSLIGAHVVWGYSLGLIQQAIEKRAQASLPHRRKSESSSQSLSF